jgi:predicted transposase/invertase (TIGR01784 family)
MDKINDISFLIDGKIVVLIEHQSTINENMPIRMLEYIVRVYEKIYKNTDLYSRKMFNIAAPEFIVLYNGKEEFPDEKTYRLSDMTKEFRGNKPINLELVVQVYNINNGRNPEFAKKSETLNGYEIFIAEIRENEKTMTREEAMKKAIKDCIKRNVLKSFLETNAKEVINMLLKEWNLEEALKVERRDGRREEQEQIARNMLNKGMDVNIISELTGLLVDNILRL